MPRDALQRILQGRATDAPFYRRGIFFQTCSAWPRSARCKALCTASGRPRVARSWVGPTARCSFDLPRTYWLHDGARRQDRLTHFPRSGSAPPWPPLHDRGCPQELRGRLVATDRCKPTASHGRYRCATPIQHSCSRKPLCYMTPKNRIDGKLTIPKIFDMHDFPTRCCKAQLIVSGAYSARLFYSGLQITALVKVARYHCACRFTDNQFKIVGVASSLKKAPPQGHRRAGSLHQRTMH
jgi:hypothetical protein